MRKYETTTRSSGGIGATGVLAIVFIVLKLVGVINWSWFWVLSPLWISIVLYLIIIVILFLIQWWLTK